ncbi:MAG TPA: FtsW/RodA/SpoVE family cell cycle protein, partial [Gemmatimonadota bacterium]|nr:FtsW/RodA/SpoVE family cell cycle protein [Gemmatimonadota bacterium]
MERPRISSPHNWYLLILALTLSVGGLALLYSAGQTATGENSGYWQFQLVWLFLAVVVYATLGFMPLRLIEKSAWVIYAGCLLLLIVVLAFPPVSGSHSWIRMGPLGFQPSEFAKIG